jgi:membrane protease YdiL (CAAX protease family)
MHVFAVPQPLLPIFLSTTFIAGLAWGYAYDKHRNLIGPIASHLVLGTLIFMIL